MSLSIKYLTAAKAGFRTLAPQLKILCFFFNYNVAYENYMSKDHKSLKIIWFWNQDATNTNLYVCSYASMMLLITVTFY